MPESLPTTIRRSEERTSQEDSDEVAHIVMRDDQMKGYVSGQPIQALCGKVWVPSRDYTGLPVCERCVDIKERILGGMKGLN